MGKDRKYKLRGTKRTFSFLFLLINPANESEVRSSNLHLPGRGADVSSPPQKIGSPLGMKGPMKREDMART